MQRNYLVHYLILSLLGPSAFAAYSPNAVVADQKNIRVEYANFGGATENVDRCSGTPCTVFRASGTWLSSVTRSGTGLYTLNFRAGVFASQPSCTTRAIEDGTGAAVCGKAAATTSSTISLACWDNSGVAKDVSAEVICVGPK